MDRASATEHLLPRRQLLPAPADVLADLGSVVDGDAAVVRPLLGALDHHDRVGTGRDDRSGHDPRRLTGADLQAADRVAGPHLADDLQEPPGALDVGAAHGEAVHRRAVGRRRVAVGVHLFTEHPTLRALQLDLDRAQRASLVAEQAQRVPKRDHLRRASKTLGIPRRSGRTSIESKPARSTIRRSSCS